MGRSTATPSGQAQKELFHNEALARIDALLQPVVEAVLLDTPPAAPVPGQCWIVGAAPSGDWSGQALAIAACTDDGWRFVAPRAGMRPGRSAQCVRATWSSGGLAVVGAQQSGIANPSGGTTPDPEARAAVSAILSALREHGLIAL